MKDKIIKLRNKGKTYDEIAAELNCSKGTISYHCGKGQKEKYKERRKRNKRGIFTKKEDKFCLNCSKKLKKNNNKYCNIKCFNEKKFKGTISNFKKGKIYTNSTLKKVVSYIEGYRCVSCGLEKYWNGKPITLEIDHIDGNSDNCLPDNLRLLCPNCHSQTPTSRGANKKKNTRRNKYLRKYKTPKI